MELGKKIFHCSPRGHFELKYKRNTQQSIQFRNEGNSMLRQRKFFEALECYNKSLMSSEPNSVERSFAYANRSAVYFEVKEYQLCLDNIQLARDSGYPVEKLQTLKDREEKCNKLMENEVKSDDDDPWKFFKLSYPANEKIPFIVECLELRKNEKFGRHIVTNRDLQPGDIIAIEEPFFKTTHPGSEHLRCANCLKCNKMSLIPHDKFVTAMFCSKTCKEETYENFLYVENVFFKILLIVKIEKLNQLLVDPELSNKTVFDFDFSNTDNPNLKLKMLTVINSLHMKTNIREENVKYYDSHVMFEHPEALKHKKTFKAFLLRLSNILETNSYGFDWFVPMADDDLSMCREEYKKRMIGEGLFIFGSLLSHSCIPNTERHVVDNQFAYIVKRVIKKGQQVTVSYGPNFYNGSRENRQKLLREKYEFDCSCEACVNDYLHLSFSWVDLGNFDRTSITNLKKEFKNNCKIIAENPEMTMKLKIVKLILKNFILLSAIAKLEPFIFLK